MTAEGYKLFYQKFYRPLVSFYLGRKVDSSTIIQGQKEYAREVFKWMKIYISENNKTLKLLDVGGSTGVVAKVFKDNLEASGFRIEATVIDPSPDELAVAKKFGLKTIEGLVEEKNIRKNSWDLILLCQTIDHLMDVTKTISTIRDSLKEDGLLFVDIVDWEFNVRRKSIRDSIKIDHPYNFTRQTTVPLLENLGFRIISESILTDGHLIGFLCKKAKASKKAFSHAHAESLLSLIRIKHAQSK
jgi:SAM-dependent methyltransferase